MAGAALLALVLTGCSSSPEVVPSAATAVASTSISEQLGALRAKVCKTDNPDEWQYCVQTAVAYLDRSLATYDDLVAAGQSSPEMSETASDLSTLRDRCALPDPTENSTQTCRYTFETIRSTGLVFQNLIKAAAGL